MLQSLFYKPDFTSVSIIAITVSIWAIVVSHKNAWSLRDQANHSISLGRYC